MSFFESSCVATKVKVILLGEPTVGKTSLISALKDLPLPQKHQSTIGIDFFSKVVNMKGRNFKLQFWDTAGQERFRSIIPSYVRNSQVGLLVFDVNNPTTIEKMEDWIEIYKENNYLNGKIILVANKCDLTEVPIKKDLQSKIDQLGIHMVYTSALKRIGIDKLEEEILLGSFLEQSEENNNNNGEQFRSFSLIKFQNNKENGKSLNIAHCCKSL